MICPAQLSFVSEINNKESKMSNCQFYITKKVRSASKVISGNRNPIKPIYHEVNKCLHPDSMNKTGTITQNVTCEGNTARCNLHLNNNFMEEL